ncbi:MAG: hypothetical protein SNF33_05195 [Candidatus Algichlamydia australiensis]|nr:hypothetical protein [Chlamydiales bacterium]
MEDEFKKILKFFDMPMEEKADKLDSVFEETSVFLERFKHVFETGTPEEKKAMIEKVLELQSRLKGEMKQLTEASGLTEEQIMQFATNPKNFKEGQWDSIESSRKKIEGQAKDIAKNLRKEFGGNKDEGSDDDDKPPSAGGGKKGWIPG